MRKWMALALLAGVSAQAQGFTVREALSAPYAWGLTAAPGASGRFAWIENAEGVRNIWVASPTETARAITRYTADDGQDIGGLAWSPDGSAIAYVLGAEHGASGKPANPAEIQSPAEAEIDSEVWVAAVSGEPPAVREGVGHSPLFLRDGQTLLYVDRGAIWIRTKEPPVAGVSKGFSRKLVFDRGSVSGLALSPDGKLLAYVSRRGAHSFIGLYDLEAKTLRFVAPSTGVDTAPVFSRDGAMLAWLRAPATEAPEFAANISSGNPWSLMVADVATLTARAVFTPSANRPGSVLPRFATGEPRVWWAAGTTLLFCAEMDGWVHLYRVDAARSPLMRDEAAHESATRNSRLQDAVLLTPWAGEVEDVSVSADGERVYFASNMREPLISAGPAAREKWELGQVEADADRRHLWRADLAHGNKLQMLSSEGIETRPVELPDGSVAALAADAQYPMHAVRVSADGRQMTHVHAAWSVRYPGEKFVEPQQVFLRAATGSRGAAHRTHSRKTRKDGTHSLRMVHAQLFLPALAAEASAKANTGVSPLRETMKPSRSSPDDASSHGTRAARHPAIVFFHGGPRRQMLLGYPAMDYYSNAYSMNQWFAAHGYVVLSVNYRCGIGYGLKFRQCMHSGADGASEYNDALAAVAYLRRRGDVDIKRVGIWGGSYGGYFTALALARNSDLFRAGVDFHGIYDWRREDNASADWLRGSLAEQEKIAARARASSPIAAVARWRSPVLLIHGDDDPEVAFAQTPANADALRARGVHVEELVFPDEVHDFLLHRDWVKAYEAMGDFFAREMK